LEQLSQFFTKTALASYGVTAVRIILIIIGAAIVAKVGKRLIDGLIRPERIPGNWSERRLQTVKGLLKSVLRYTIYFVGAMMVLQELDLPVESILAGAGVVGLAVGFGAQNLVRDVISGFFILFEDQYAVGDYITAAGVTGVVEEMGLRVTRLRADGGELHVVPNGEIKQVTNFSRGPIGVSIDINVPYDADLELVKSVIEAACREVAGEHPQEIQEPPHVLGVVDLASAVTLRVWGRVQPMQQWAAARELRERIKQELDRAGVQIAYPSQVVICKKDEGAQA
jgi:small-conductance mechanosensitive channel